MDNRGRGLSDDPGKEPGAYTLDKDVEDIEAVRHALRAEKIVVFGHSYGSMVAMAYATRFREQTLALITCAGVHGAKVFQERNIDGVKRYLETHNPIRWKQIVRMHENGVKTTDTGLAKLFDVGEDYYFHNPSAEARVRAQFDRMRNPRSLQWNPDVYRQMIGEDPEWTLSGSLAGVELLSALRNYKGPGADHGRALRPRVPAEQPGGDFPVTVQRPVGHLRAQRVTTRITRSRCGFLTSSLTSSRGSLSEDR